MWHRSRKAEITPGASRHYVRAGMGRNIPLLYGFSFFDQFMIVIAVWVPFFSAKGIGMQQFMELQAIFAVVILLGEVPSGLLSDLWGRKKTLLLGATLKAVGFSMLPFWDSYEGFLVYHLTMGVALSLISGGDVAFLYDSYLATETDKGRGATVLGNAKFAATLGETLSALIGGAIVILSFDHLLWVNAVFSWIPVLLVLSLAELPRTASPRRNRAEAFKEVLENVLVRDRATRCVFLNLVVSGFVGLMMFWVNQKYWQETGVPLAWFGVLLAAYSLVDGFAARFTARAVRRYGWRPLLTVVGLLPVLAFFSMAFFFGWAGIAFGFLFKIGRGLGGVLFLEALNERISSTYRATVISLSQLGLRGAFMLLGPLAGYGIDAWGLPSVLSALALLFAFAFVLLIQPLTRSARVLQPDDRSVT
jgi:MFS family permease